MVSWPSSEATGMSFSSWISNTGRSSLQQDMVNRCIISFAHGIYFFRMEQLKKFPILDQEMTMALKAMTDQDQASEISRSQPECENVHLLPGLPATKTCRFPSDTNSSSSYLKESKGGKMVAGKQIECDVIEVDGSVVDSKSLTMVNDESGEVELSRRSDQDSTTMTPIAEGSLEAFRSYSSSQRTDVPHDDAPLMDPSMGHVTSDTRSSIGIMDSAASKVGGTLSPLMALSALSFSCNRHDSQNRRMVGGMSSATPRHHHCSNPEDSRKRTIQVIDEVLDLLQDDLFNENDFILSSRSNRGKKMRNHKTPRDQ